MANFRFCYDLNKHISDRDSILELHPASWAITAIELLIRVNICGIVTYLLSSFFYFENEISVFFYYCHTQTEKNLYSLVVNQRICSPQFLKSDSFSYSQFSLTHLVSRKKVGTTLKIIRTVNMLIYPITGVVKNYH
jgi:hypothetical protein